jgi:flotillin
MSFFIWAILAAFVLLLIIMSFASWYRKCPSDRIMVIYGRTRGNQAALCIHGGAKFVIPLFQDYGYISLRPLQITVNLDNALCKQNIRINVPSVFTVGVSTSPEIMGNAAERLFGQSPEAIAELAKDIIFGQLRLVIASMMIEEINADRETFLRAVEANVAEELKKIGLELLNVNITDITDESGYISAIGQRAAAGAINTAKIDVAEENRKGSIGAAEASKYERIAVSKAEAEATAGEADAERERRIAVKQADAAATQGENISAIEIAKSNASRSEEEAEAFRRAEAARQIAAAKIEQAKYEAEAEAQRARARMEEAKQEAEVIVQAEISKRRVEIEAEAEAERIRREAKGQADAIFAKLEAEAKGNFEILKAKGEGYRQLVTACGEDSEAAGRMMLIEKLQELVALQAEAIKNIKIDKVTVWDGGNKGDGKTATADFLSGMLKSLPPLHDVASMAGLKMPDYLGKVEDNKETNAENIQQ